MGSAHHILEDGRRAELFGQEYCMHRIRPVPEVGAGGGMRAERRARQVIPTTSGTEGGSSQEKADKKTTSERAAKRRDGVHEIVWQELWEMQPASTPAMVLKPVMFSRGS